MHCIQTPGDLYYIMRPQKVECSKMYNNEGPQDFDLHTGLE
jgi:hypothetical protein